MSVPYVLQATSGAVKLPSDSPDHTRLDKPLKLIDHTEPSATRSAAKNEYGGSFFSIAAADLVACTSRLQTASLEAEELFFLLAFLADLREGIYSPKL